jgi:hypothetical protein
MYVQSPSVETVTGVKVSWTADAVKVVRGVMIEAANKTNNTAVKVSFACFMGFA